METTLERARENSHKATVNVLQDLLKKNHEAEKLYKKAIVKVRTLSLKSFLQQQALQHSHFVTAIDNELRNLDETPVEKGTTAGVWHQTWMDIKSSMVGNDDEAMLKEMIRMEKTIVDDYQELLRAHALAPKIDSLLHLQLETLQAMLNRIKTLRDIA